MADHDFPPLHARGIRDRGAILTAAGPLVPLPHIGQPVRLAGDVATPHRGALGWIVAITSARTVLVEFGGGSIRLWCRLETLQDERTTRTDAVLDAARALLLIPTRETRAIHHATRRLEQDLERLEWLERETWRRVLAGTAAATPIADQAADGAS